MGLDDNGMPDLIWAVTLVQALRLNLGESPFYANYGIPAKASLIQQIAPDFYVSLTRQYFAPYFASLLLAKLPNEIGDPTPRYRMVATANYGYVIDMEIPT